jgi:hypothetical protein
MLQFTKMLVESSIFRSAVIVLAALLSALTVLSAHAGETNQANDSAQIMRAFNQQHREAEHAKSITDKDKQRVMFLLGVTLLTLVLITGGLGIAMGVYGKQVFVAHMIFAGLSMTLAIAHAIVGIVWFYPY